MPRLTKLHILSIPLASSAAVDAGLALEHRKEPSKICQATWPLQRFGSAATHASVAPAVEATADENLPPALYQVGSEKSLSCEWSVTYDLWLPGFEHHVYMGHEDSHHCLQACCHDPTCHGLQLMSSETFQCFKYSHLPQSLALGAHKHRSKPLGDGLWLSHQPGRWSVFVKGAPVAAAQHQKWHHAPQFALARDEPQAHYHDKCKFIVHYDLWAPGFDHGTYRGAGVNQGGVHCLEACCRDPTCHGLQLMSNEHFQCYKYSHVPAKVGQEHRDTWLLGDGHWLQEAPARWSVFVKATPGQRLPPVPNKFVASSVEKKREQTEMQGLHFSKKSHTDEASTCNWTVHYDLWTGAGVLGFDEGEYEPNTAAQGGAHCLEACCQDPTCHGLALESLEKYQCYRYSKLPPVLRGPHSHHGTPLGDGLWLNRLPVRWSVFVKHGVTLAPGLPLLPKTVPAPEAPRKQPQPQTLAVPFAPGARAAMKYRRPAPTPDAAQADSLGPPAVVQLFGLGVIVVVVTIVGSYVSGDPTMRRAFSKATRFGMEAHMAPEACELLTPVSK